MSNETQRTYTPALKEKMLSYFAYREGGILPSFQKFAFANGYTSADLHRFCTEDAAFAEAYAECKARLCDMLIDGALAKRYDGTFTRFLLTSVFGMTEDGGHTDDAFSVEIKVEEAPTGNA